MAECSICYEETQEVGEIACAHRFCYPCISTWAQTETSCPLCKVIFTSIRRKRLAEEVSPADDNPMKRLKGTVLEEFPVEQRRQHWQPEDLNIDLSEVRCQVCGTDDDPDHLLLCDSCDRAAHTWCVGLDSVPTSDWHCPHCQQRRAAGASRRRAAALRRRARAAPTTNTATATGRNRSASGARQGRGPQGQSAAGAGTGRSRRGGPVASRVTRQGRRQLRRRAEVMESDSEGSASDSSGDGFIVSSESGESDASSAEEVEVVGEGHVRARQRRVRQSGQQRGRRGMGGGRGGGGRSGGPASRLRGMSSREAALMEEEEEEEEYLDSQEGSSSSAEERAGDEDEEPEWEWELDSGEDGGDGVELGTTRTRSSRARGRANTRAAAQARRGRRGGNTRTQQRQAAAAVAAGAVAESPEEQGDPQAGSASGQPRRNRSRAATRWTRRLERITQEQAALAAAARQGHASRTAERAAMAAARSMPSSAPGEGDHLAGLVRTPSRPLHSISSPALPSGTHLRTATRTVQSTRRFQQTQRHRDVSAVEAMRTGGWQALREEEGVINLADSPSLPDSPQTLGSEGRPEQLRRGVARPGHRRIDDDDDGVNGSSGGGGNASGSSDEVPLAVRAQRAQARAPSPSPLALPLAERLRIRGLPLQGQHSHSLFQASSSAGAGASPAAAAEQADDKGARSSSPDMIPLRQRLQLHHGGEGGGGGEANKPSMPGAVHAAQTPAEVRLLRAGGLIKDEVGMASLARPPPAAVAAKGGRSPYYVGMRGAAGSSRQAPHVSEPRQRLQAHLAQQRAQSGSSRESGQTEEDGMEGRARGGRGKEEDEVLWEEADKARRAAQQQLQRQQQQQQQQEGSVSRSSRGGRAGGAGGALPRLVKKECEGGRRQQQQQQQQGRGQGMDELLHRGGSGGSRIASDLDRIRRAVPRSPSWGASPSWRIKEEPGPDRGANSRDKGLEGGMNSCGPPRVKVEPGQIGRTSEGAIAGLAPVKSEPLTPSQQAWPHPRAAVQPTPVATPHPEAAMLPPPLPPYPPAPVLLPPPPTTAPPTVQRATQAAHCPASSCHASAEQPPPTSNPPPATQQHPWSHEPPQQPAPQAQPPTYRTHPAYHHPHYPQHAPALPPYQGYPAPHQHLHYRQQHHLHHPQQSQGQGPPPHPLPTPTVSPYFQHTHPASQPHAALCGQQHMALSAAHHAFSSSQIHTTSQGQAVPQHHTFPTTHTHAATSGQAVQQPAGHAGSHLADAQHSSQVHLRRASQVCMLTPQLPNAAVAGAAPVGHAQSPKPLPTLFHPCPPINHAHQPTSTHTPQPLSPPAFCHTPATAPLSHNTIIPATPSTCGAASNSSPFQSLQGRPGSVKHERAAQAAESVGHEQQRGGTQQEGTQQEGMQQQQQQQQQQVLQQRALEQQALQQRALELQVEAWLQEQEYIEAMYSPHDSHQHQHESQVPQQQERQQQTGRHGEVRSEAGRTPSSSSSVRRQICTA